MEVENMSISKIKQNIAKEDLDVNMRCGIVLSSNFGSLIALREAIARQFPNLVYFTVSSQTLYVVHWNDLSEKKQLEIEKRRVVNE